MFIKCFDRLSRAAEFLLNINTIHHALLFINPVTAQGDFSFAISNLPRPGPIQETIAACSEVPVAWPR